MANVVLNKSILIHENLTDDNLSGELILKASDTIQIEHIALKIFIEEINKNTFSDVLSHFSIQNSPKTLVKNETYRFPFVIRLKKKLVPSFKGKLIHINYRCEAQIKVDGISYQKLEKSRLENIKGIFTSEYYVFTNKNFDIKHRQALEVIEKNYVLTPVENYYIIAFVIVLLIIYISIMQDKFETLSTTNHIIGIAAPVFIVGLILFLYKKLVGTFAVTIKKNENTFTGQFRNDKGLHLKKYTVYYEHIESVITSQDETEVTEKIVYQSKKQNITNLKKAIVFEYPTTNNIPSFTLGRVSLAWRMHIKGYNYFGLPISYETDFITRQ